MAGTPTVLDTPNKAALNTGVGLVRLPSDIQNRYRVRQRLPTAGAEADLFVVEATAGADTELRVLKLYRFGIQPKADVLERVRNGSPEHLIRIHEFGQSDGHWYELMEYATHGTFRQLLKGKALPQQNLLEVIRELAIGLEHLHGFGLIHRDLKPENILVRETFPLDLVITDFGISSVSEMSQRFTGASRTVRYAAPEALSGVISSAVDYWSLGIIVAEAAMGHHPFAQLSDERAVMQWLTTRPIDVSEIQDSRIQNLCRGLLQRDPAKRWGAEQLSRWLGGDATLLAPEDRPTDANVSGSNEQRAKTAYKIAGEECWTPTELGVALARRWKEARRDLGRGLVRKWCEREFNEVATERFFLDLEEEYDQSADDDEKAQKSLDHQLLDVILHLCPDIPPVYLGRNLASKADIAAVLDQARSVAESEDAEVSRTIIRELVGTQVSGPLLSRFKLPPHHELIPVQEALQELVDLGEIYPDKSTCPEVFVPQQIYGIPQDIEWMLDSDSDAGLTVALAIDPLLSEKIKLEAVQFSETSQFKFWLHKCLGRDLFPAHWIRNAVALHQTLNRAKGWHATVLNLVGQGHLNQEPLKTPWIKLLSNVSSKEDMDEALHIAASLQNADFDSLALSIATVARWSNLPYDQESWKRQTFQSIADSLSARCNGDDAEIKAWCKTAKKTSGIISSINKAIDGAQGLPQVYGTNDSRRLSDLLQPVLAPSRNAASVDGLGDIAKNKLPALLEYSQLLNEISLAFAVAPGVIHNIARDSLDAAKEMTETALAWRSMCAYAMDLSSSVEADSISTRSWQLSSSQCITLALESVNADLEQWHQWKILLSEISITTKEPWFLERSKALFGFLKAGKRSSPLVWGVLSEAVKKALPQDPAQPLHDLERFTKFLTDAVKLSHASVETNVKNPESLDRVISGLPPEKHHWAPIDPSALSPHGRGIDLQDIERFAGQSAPDQSDISLSGGQLYRRKFAPIKGPFGLNPRQFTAGYRSHELQPIPDQKSIQLVSTIDDTYAVYEGTEDSAITVALSKQAPENFWLPITLFGVVELKDGERYRLDLKTAIPLEQSFRLNSESGPLIPILFSTEQEISLRSTPFQKWSIEKTSEDKRILFQKEEAARKSQSKQREKVFKEARETINGIALKILKWSAPFILMMNPMLWLGILTLLLISKSNLFLIITPLSPWLAAFFTHYLKKLIDIAQPEKLLIIITELALIGFLLTFGFSSIDQINEKYNNPLIYISPAIFFFGIFVYLRESFNLIKSITDNT